MASTKGRQIAKPTKRQLGFAIWQNVLGQMSQLANGVRDALHKGRMVDMRTQEPVPMGCAPADVKRAASPEQLAAVEEFISNFATDAEPEPRAAAPPSAQKKKKK